MRNRLAAVIRTHGAALHAIPPHSTVVLGVLWTGGMDLPQPDSSVGRGEKKQTNNTRRYCCVKDCHNKEGDVGVMMYRFPSRPWEAARRQKWIAAVRRVKWMHRAPGMVEVVAEDNDSSSNSIPAEQVDDCTDPATWDGLNLLCEAAEVH
ncbi:hypothetical protein MRX96_006684 [Rhipicephalus microplus]